MVDYNINIVQSLTLMTRRTVVWRICTPRLYGLLTTRTGASWSIVGFILIVLTVQTHVLPQQPQTSAEMIHQLTLKMFLITCIVILIL